MIYIYIYTYTAHLDTDHFEVFRVHGDAITRLYQTVAVVVEGAYQHAQREHVTQIRGSFVLFSCYVIAWNNSMVT